MAHDSKYLKKLVIFSPKSGIFGRTLTIPEREPFGGLVGFTLRHVDFSPHFRAKLGKSLRICSSSLSAYGCSEISVLPCDEQMPNLIANIILPDTNTTVPLVSPSNVTFIREMVGAPRSIDFQFYTRLPLDMEDTQVYITIEDQLEITLELMFNK
jgi:hypothetical protein